MTMHDVALPIIPKSQFASDAHLLQKDLRRFSQLPETRRLAAFVVVSEELHFRRAAARLGMKQSPLSRLIIDLERDIGFQLFVRTRRSVRLTVSGVRLLAHARGILAAVEFAMHDGPMSLDHEERSQFNG